MSEGGEMKFSKRLEYQKEYEKWLLKVHEGYVLSNCLLNTIHWLTTTPKGRELIERLVEEVT